MVASVWKQAGREIVLDLVADANSGFQAVRSNFAFSTLPVATADGSAKNTQATLSPSEAGSATYEGDVVVQWNRIQMEAYVDGVLTGNTADYVPDADNGKPRLTAGLIPSDVVSVINAVLGLQAVVADFTAESLAVTKVSDTQFTITPVASENTFMFLGSTTLTLNQAVEKQQTSSVVQNTELDGLDAPTSGS